MVGIINCTNHCNMACKYCFEENWKEKGINKSSINQKFKEAFNLFVDFSLELSSMYSDQLVDILLHGGEPLLIDIKLLNDFFEKVSQSTSNIRFLIQTNGTIMNDEIIQVLKKYNVIVGVSLDGTEETHDLYRVFKTGRPTYDAVIDNIKFMKENGLNVGCLTTLTKEALKKIDEIYTTFSSLEIDFSFNPFFEPCLIGYDEMRIEKNDYASAICKLFDLWIEDENSNIQIPSFERIIDGLTNREHENHTCNTIKNCAESFIAIDINGYLYPCNHFCGNQKYSFGIYELGKLCSLMEKNPIHKRWDILKDNECKNCPIQNMCFGGCPYHSLIYNDTLYGKDFICESQKIIINHIFNYLSKYE